MSGEADPADRRSQRRTNVVYLLGRMDTPITIDELVDELRRHADRQPDSPGVGGSWEELHERLHEEDLPALDRAGLLTFDEERGMITHASPPERGPFAANPGTESEAPGDAARARDADESGGRSVARYQLGLALLVTVVLVATTLGVGPFADLPRDRVATVLVVVLVAASVVTAFKNGT